MNDGNAASASVASASVHLSHSWSVSWTPAQPSYNRSTCAGSSKGKGDKGGGKGASSYKPEGVSPKGTFAAIAPSGQVIIPGGKTGLEVLEPALANMPVLLSTREGGPPTDMDFGLCKIPGCPPPDDAEYLRQQCQHVWEPDESEEWFDSRTEWLNRQEEEEEDLNCYTEYD